MDANNKRKRAAWWIGLALLGLLFMGGEMITQSFGWKYPEWLRILSGFVELIISGLLLVPVLINPLWRGRR